MKWCPGCNVDKREEDFHKSSNRTDGLNGHCKSCQSHKHRLRTYGLTIDQFNEMVREQDNRCPLCLKVFTKPAVDHDHKTGKVRELLCIPCNRALGYVENTPWRKRAVAYLRKHK